ncbi:MAG: helix-turn-helix transcriptional regulator [Polyangiaceae bacterium]
MSKATAVQAPFQPFFAPLVALDSGNPPSERAGVPYFPNAGRRLTAPLAAALNDSERKRLIDVDQTQGGPLDMANLWTALCAGKLRVSKVFQNGPREYMLLDETRGSAQHPQALEVRQARMLERLLAGSSQKAIGIDFGVCSSTVSMSVGAGLSRLGLHCSVSRLPLLLNLVVLSGHAVGHSARGCVADARTGARLISVEWPRGSLLDPLTSSERAVVELLIEGLTAREIAKRRATSMRTVANQLAAAFTKFKLSGRVELMAHLAKSTLRAGLREAFALPRAMVH